MSLLLYPRTVGASAGTIQACSPWPVNATFTQAKKLVTTGVGPATMCILSALVNKATKSVYMVQMDDLVGYEWSAGTWTAQIRVSVAADGDLDWRELHICRLDKNNNNLGSVASNTSDIVDLTSTGLKNMSAVQASPLGGFSQSDRLYMVCVFKQIGVPIHATFTTQLDTQFDTPLTPMITTVQVRGCNLLGAVVAP